MNNSFNPVRGFARFLLATLAAFASSMVVNAALAPFNPFQGDTGQAFFRLFLGSSMIVGNLLLFLIQDSRLHGSRLFGLTLLAYVGSAQLLGHVEMVAFNFMFGFSAGEIVFLVVSQALTALLFVPLVITVAGKWKAPAVLPEDRTGPFLPATRGSFLIRLAVLAALWYFCYMFAGFLIADPVTHDYYAAKHPDLASINSWLPILQFFRGIAWTLLLILGVRIMNRPLRESGLLVGLAYGVFHSAGLLLPSPFMPAEMRLSHLPEIIVSLALQGTLVVSVMAWRKREATV
ncbi:MAG: hypothetical protein A2Z99_14860 [Treponema sp. GWB1_62_6]|nr:MAG: hypothetical protein A2Z99_14860 [Treponema sp. GWB1_62_6]